MGGIEWPAVPDPLPIRLVRIREALADLARFAPALWDGAPSFAMAPPLTESEVAAAERELGVALPEEYRGFLREVGSAGPGPDYGLAGPAGWPMPDELPEVTATVTTVDGQVFTAGTPERAPLPGEPDPARPFRLTGLWTYGDPLPADGHLYDGCLHLNDIGCGYSSFLVVTGPQRGMVWVDYSAGDGDIAPVVPFLDWYEHWLDQSVTWLLVGAAAEALDAGEPGPYEAELNRWAGCFERTAASGRPTAVADLAVLRLYQGRRDEALALVDRLDDDSTVDGQVERLTRWASRDAVSADHPRWRIRRLVAEDPATPAAVVAQLATDERHEVRLAAAARPELSAEALAALAAGAERRWSPDDRIARLLELDAVARHPATDQSTVVSLATLDERIADELASNVVRAVAQRPSAPAELLARLGRSPWPWVRAAVAGNRATPAGTLAALAGDPHPAVRAAVAAQPGADPGLADDPAVPVRLAAADNPAMPASALRRLGTDRHRHVAYHLARNPSVPEEVLEVLRLHPSDPMPRDGDTQEPGPTATLTELLSHRRTGREVNWSNPVGDADYPHALLAEAIAHPDDMVGYGAGSSPWLDEPLLRALARHPYAYARLHVLDQPTPPVDVILSLVDDPVAMVVRSAVARPEVGAEVAARVADSEDAEHRWGAAENPNLPADVLHRLASDENVYVRRAVLGNPNTLLSDVERLISDPEMLVRRVAGTRDDLTEAMVATLLADPEPDVQRTARWFLARRRIDG